MRLNFLQVGRSAGVALATRPQANAALAALVMKLAGQSGNSKLLRDNSLASFKPVLSSFALLQRRHIRTAVDDDLAWFRGFRDFAYQFDGQHAVIEARAR